jgi:hypothetical protein
LEVLFRVFYLSLNTRESGFPPYFPGIYFPSPDFEVKSKRSIKENASVWIRERQYREGALRAEPESKNVALPGT